jgi:hypothetical protein
LTVLAFFAAALAATAAPVPATPTTPSTTPAPAPATPANPVLESAMPWWERITVTVDDKGTKQNCRYQISTSPRGAEACDKATAAGISAVGTATSGVYTKMTYERRFSPGGKLDSGRLQPGDTLLGRQVMYLTIDPKDSILSCKVVAASGASPNYDCDTAKKEQFRASPTPAPAARQAFMTVLAYGHTERVV